MLEWGDVPGDETKRQIYHNGIPQPGAVFNVVNVRSVNRVISDQPTYAETIAKEIIRSVENSNSFPPFTMTEAADFLIDTCEEEV